ncbi:MAG: SpoIIE family protein phosphatase [Gemmatimonadetes bacterium]|nr:SpoIIE family protein phosphatase [Gemmatimonadota bacterium]MYF18679.1 SpoIIE family protein phosphatase [Gemmatimonadota bacterium]
MKKAQYKILVVDDEPDLEHLVRQRMRRDVRAGLYEFVFAYNGVEALEVLNADPDIDMVLSDINMPRMDGLTLLEQMSEVDPDLRAVIVSAYGDMKNIRTAMNRGAFDFVTKPIDFQDLRVTIERTLEHLQMWREAVASRDKLVALQNELRVAHEMQQSILPKVFPNKPGYQLFGNMEPAREVGGDFFDIINLENDCVGLAIADVSDKGVPAALFMMSSRTLMKGAAIGRSNPAEVLSEVNNLLQEDNDAAMFVTVFYAEYNPGSGVLSYANGGHNPPIVVHADGSSTVLPQTNGIALGIMPDIKYEQNSVTLSPGDALVLYTDGVTEAMNAQNEEFEMERLLTVLSEHCSCDVREINQAVFQAVQGFAGDMPQFDDMTCMTLICREIGI